MKFPIRFEDPLFLLLALLPLFLYTFFKKNDQTSSIAFPLGIPKGVSGFDPLIVLRSLKTIAFLMMVVALARPQIPLHHTEKTVSGIDIVLLMDVSASMNIEDLGGRSRIDVAKDTLKHFVESRQNDRMGFVVFSGEPFTLAPPTLDHGLLLATITDVKPGEVLKDGTAIGDGLSMAVARLRKSNAKSRTIILVTDGESNVGQIDPLTAGELAKGFGMKVYTIAIGTEGRVKLPIRSPGPFGTTVTSYQWFDNALNPDLLIKIADLTGGKFFRATDDLAVQKVFETIDQLEKTEIKTKNKTKYYELFLVFSLVGATALALWTLLATTLWRIAT